MNAAKGVDCTFKLVFPKCLAVGPGPLNVGSMRERSQIVCVQEIPVHCVSLICFDTAMIVRVG